MYVCTRVFFLFVCLFLREKDEGRTKISFSFSFVLPTSLADKNARIPRTPLAQQFQSEAESKTKMSNIGKTKNMG